MSETGSFKNQLEAKQAELEAKRKEREQNEKEFAKKEEQKKQEQAQQNSNDLSDFLRRKLAANRLQIDDVDKNINVANNNQKISQKPNAKKTVEEPIAPTRPAVNTDDLMAAIREGRENGFKLRKVNVNPESKNSKTKDDDSLSTMFNSIKDKVTHIQSNNSQNNPDDFDQNFDDYEDNNATLTANTMPVQPAQAIPVATVKPIVIEKKPEQTLVGAQKVAPQLNAEAFIVPASTIEEPILAEKKPEQTLVGAQKVAPQLNAEAFIVPASTIEEPIFVEKKPEQKPVVSKPKAAAKNEKPVVTEVQPESTYVRRPVAELREFFDDGRNHFYKHKEKTQETKKAAPVVVTELQPIDYSPIKSVAELREFFDDGRNHYYKYKDKTEETKKAAPVVKQVKPTQNDDDHLLAAKLQVEELTKEDFGTALKLQQEYDRKANPLAKPQLDKETLYQLAGDIYSQGLNDLQKPAATTSVSRKKPAAQKPQKAQEYLGNFAAMIYVETYSLSLTMTANGFIMQEVHQAMLMTMVGNEKNVQVSVQSQSSARTNAYHKQIGLFGSAMYSSHQAAYNVQQPVALETQKEDVPGLRRK